MKYLSRFLLLPFFILFYINSSFAQNPFITDQFTADPAARVFDGKVYVYPSHDIPCGEGQGFIGFCMADYHVFSSENLTDWTDHGVIVSQDKVDWVNPVTFSMWAPDCIFKNGKYYFYFPAASRDTTFGRFFAIGAAVADKPYGPFIPEIKPIKGIFGIDPNPFIDKDGQVYIYWAGRGGINMAKLNDNMLELASEPKVIEGLPEGFKEGPYMFERNGIYYLTYPHVKDSVEYLAYSVGDNPLGPFKYMGVIMDESPTGCWTNHQSFIEYKNQWYLFYHHNDYSPQFDKNRSIRVDSLFFADDGSIQKVIPTFRGVGVTIASKEIQIDRYSRLSSNGASIAFLDTLNKFEGWKVILDAKDSWVQYNSVSFESNSFNSVTARVNSLTGGTMELRLDNPEGTLLAEFKIDAGNGWNNVSFPLSVNPSGTQNIVLVLKDGISVETDWITFDMR